MTKPEPAKLEAVQAAFNAAYSDFELSYYKSGQPRYTGLSFTNTQTRWTVNTIIADSDIVEMDVPRVVELINAMCDRHRRG